MELLYNKRMDIFALNVTIDLTCLTVLLALVISQIYRHTQGRFDRSFLTVLVMNMVNIFAELMSWLCEGYGSQPLLFLNHLFNTAAYFNAGISFTALFWYLVNVLNSGKKPGRRDRLLLFLSCIPASVLILLAVTNHFTHLLFFINDNYYYQTGPLAKIYDWFMFFEQFLLLYAVWSHRETDRHIRIQTGILGFMLMGAAMLDIVLSDIELTYPVIVLALIVIYIDLLIVVEKQIELTELEIVSGRYALILGKMRPAFVNLVLGRIEELIRKDSEKAQWMISEFSDYLRGNIDRIDRNELIPFENELEHIVHYINLVRLKYEDFEFIEDLKIRGFSIPVRTILPVAEQFVIAIDSFPGSIRKIEIFTYLKDGRVYVEVTGPAMPEHEEISRAYELYNYVMARLMIVKDASMILYCDTGRRAHAVISLPRSMEADGNA